MCPRDKCSVKGTCSSVIHVLICIQKAVAMRAAHEDMAARVDEKDENMGQVGRGERQKPLHGDGDDVRVAGHYAAEHGVTHSSEGNGCRRMQTHVLAPLIKVIQGGIGSLGLDCRRQITGTSPSFATCECVSVQRGPKETSWCAGNTVKFID